MPSPAAERITSHGTVHVPVSVASICLFRKRPIAGHTDDTPAVRCPPDAWRQERGRKAALKRIRIATAPVRFTGARPLPLNRSVEAECQIGRLNQRSYAQDRVAHRRIRRLPIESLGAGPTPPCTNFPAAPRETAAGLPTWATLRVGPRASQNREPGAGLQSGRSTIPRKRVGAANRADDPVRDDA